MGLQTYIEQRKKQKDILVMAHVVCGYPSFEANMQALEIMADAGVDLVPGRQKRAHPYPGQVSNFATIDILSSELQTMS